MHRQKAAQLQAPQILTSSAQVHMTGTFQGKRNPSEGREYRSTGIKAREKPFTYQEKFYPSCIINSQHISVPKNQFTLEKKKKRKYPSCCFVNINSKAKRFFGYFKIGYAKFKSFSKSAKMLYFKKF